MSLNDGKVGAAIAVADMARAVEFYEGRLGLKGVYDRRDHRIRRLVIEREFEASDKCQVV
jgi:catechol 2,3-dioxygenase-like lactoylglutathione lyase family enzyme